MIREGLKNLAAGANPVVMKKGMAKAVETAVSAIKANSQKVNGTDDIARAHVLERIVELNLLGDGHAVVGDQRSAELLVENDVAALGAEGDLHGIGQSIDADFKRLAGLFAGFNELRHKSVPPLEISRNAKIV